MYYYESIIILTITRMLNKHLSLQAVDFEFLFINQIEVYYLAVTC